jgi:sulfate adenylyltransferase subunit 2
VNTPDIAADGSCDLLRALEAEAIHVLRETAAACARPVLLYSIGKDSSVLLHLALKAFAPAKPPFPLLHIDTGWKFREMIAFRDATAARTGLPLIVWRHPEAGAVSPFVEPARYTRLCKTEALRRALAEGGYDAAIGGARRDEEKSRAKERIYSLRGAGQGWDPRRQRPEPWDLFNPERGPDESFRVFPLSNWSELDVWRYIAAENIPVVPLYFAAPRPLVRRAGALIQQDDSRLVLQPGERLETQMARFRTLGCYPLTGAFLSQAQTVEAVIAELAAARLSERAGRLIDHDDGDSMERKKREGYF